MTQSEEPARPAAVGRGGAEHEGAEHRAETSAAAGRGARDSAGRAPSDAAAGDAASAPQASDAVAAESPAPDRAPASASAANGFLRPARILWSELRIVHGAAWRTLRRHWAVLTPLAVLLQVAVAFVAMPLLGGAFRFALSSAGLHGFELANAGLLLSNPLSDVVVVLIGLAALAALSAQLGVLVIAVEHLQTGERLTPGGLLLDVLGLVRRLAHPTSLLLLAYLFVVVPLGHAGYASALTNGIAIPNFVAGELEKTDSGRWLVTGVIALIAYLNVRLSLTLPVFASRPVSAFAAVRASWRYTRWRTPLIVVSVAGAVAIWGLVTLLVIVIGLGSTVIADTAAPALAPTVAAIALALAQVIGTIASGCAIVTVVALLVAVHRRREAMTDDIPDELQVEALQGLERGGVPEIAHSRRGWTWGWAWSHKLGSTELAAATDRFWRRASGTRRDGSTSSLGIRRPILVVSIAGAVVSAVVLGVVNLPVMNALAAKPDTLVIAHRGDIGGGVENTIPALEAAAQAGADYVEMDVLETRDGRFVVMHDSNLKRLSGRGVNVADLTLDELTAITVSDGRGHEARIPSLDEYARRAKELGMPLLVELKTHGGESADYVARLVAELEAIGPITDNIFHSLDKGFIEQLKQQRPEVYAGYILPFAVGGLPPTTVDFYVVEEGSANASTLAAARAAGKSVFVWTVNDEGSMRQRMRDGVEGIITDHPAAGVLVRSDLDRDRGLAVTLVDAVDRFVTL